MDRNGDEFPNYPYAPYALDVKFQPAYRPSGRFAEQKHYFSGNHKLYGFKIECAVVPPGLAVHVSKHYPGSVSDITICMINLVTHQRMLTKTSSKASRNDYGEGSTSFAAMWGAIIPKRRPRGGALTFDEESRNRRVSSARVLVENYFGRMTSLWRVCSTTFTWHESKFDRIINICVALTNFHARLHHLRAEDQDMYEQILSRYVSMAEEQRRKRQRERVIAEARRGSARTSLDSIASSSTIRSSSPASTTMGDSSQEILQACEEVSQAYQAFV
ncbi:hypothetical protein PHMEG_00019215 [Phytophthora megakarya]|uniref:DDE Tnp4 domain-containing protein n=1 Tax=Phytophthora megakarya TaxID=4795 RepID=A0A225VS59_9STRA|nr:hypothetical protein PHMEG_00019215 [Phytophthora megakarya]